MKKKIKHTSYKKRKYAPKRTLADVLDENYISKKDLERRYLRAFTQMYQAKKEGWKLKSARELINEL